MDDDFLFTIPFLKSNQPILIYLLCATLILHSSNFLIGMSCGTKSNVNLSAGRCQHSPFYYLALSKKQVLFAPIDLFSVK